MIRKKNTALIFIIFLLSILLLANAGCRKCYTCAGWRGSFKCIRNTDTIGFFEGIRSDAIDTLKYYRNLGYRCDTGGIYYDPSIYLSPVCGRKNYNDAINASSECYLRQ